MRAKALLLATLGDLALAAVLVASVPIELLMGLPKLGGYLATFLTAAIFEGLGLLLITFLWGVMKIEFDEVATAQDGFLSLAIIVGALVICTELAQPLVLKASGSDLGAWTFTSFLLLWPQLVLTLTSRVQNQNGQKAL